MAANPDQIVVLNGGESLDTRQIIHSFLNAVGYDSPRVMMESQSALDALVNAIGLEVESWKVDDGQGGKVFAATTRKAASVIEFFYYHHPFQIKVAFGLYVWFFFYIDDASAQPYLEDFQRRQMLGLPQVHPPFTHFLRILGDLYTYWDPVCANAMICSAFEFVSGTILEGRKEIKEMKPSHEAVNWPRYLRVKTGMAPGFSCMTFPRSLHPDVSTYIQALPDIEDFLGYANDILSFHKEELASEEMTYVEIRSKVTGKPAKRVLFEMVQEMSDANRRIIAMLEKDPAAAAAWKTLKDGFMAFHLSQERYKLKEFGLQW